MGGAWREAGNLADLGPDSLLWQWAGDTRIGFMAASIGLLQVMHPAIGAGVVDHSDFFGDPYGRIFRSVPWIIGVVYDGPEADTGRQVRDFHRDIKGVQADGCPYHALEPETFWWAHATFQYMTEQVAERFERRPLSSADREQLYQEGVTWYLRYGVSARVVPPDRTAFAAMWDRYCRDVLEMTPAAERVLDLILRPQRASTLPADVSWLATILRSATGRRMFSVPLRLSAIGGLPPIVRSRFGIPWTRQDAMALAALERTVRNTWPLLPANRRWHPRAAAAWQRTRAAAAS